MMANKQVTVSDIIYDGTFWLSSKMKEKYCEYFKSTKMKNDHFLTGAEVAALVKDKGLSMKDLFQVWNFADTDEDGCLSIDEFCLAMAMIDTLKERRKGPGFIVLKKSGLRVTIKKGNIEKEESDMIVCLMDEMSGLTDGLVSSCICLAGGRELLQMAGDRMYDNGIKNGQIVALPAEGELKCSHVVAGTIPEFEDESSLKAMRKFIHGCLQLANDHGAKSIAFPLLGTGGLAYEKNDVVRILFEVMEDFPNRDSLTDVALVAHPMDRTSLHAFKAAEARYRDSYMYRVKENLPSKVVQWNGQYCSLPIVPSLDSVPEERRKDYEKNFAEYAVINKTDSSYSITGKRLMSIFLLQTGVDFYTVQQIMCSIGHQSDKSQITLREFFEASALMDKVREGYLLRDISKVYLIRDELYNNIEYLQHIFDPRYCLSWFSPQPLDFVAANAILKMPGHQDGSFLVWRPKSGHDAYFLSTIYGHEISHRKIEFSGATFSVQTGCRFQQLGCLVHHYMHHQTPWANRTLRYPIPVNIPSTRSWFCPNISPVSSILLLEHFYTGHNFMVRYSTGTPGGFALMIRNSGQTMNIKIIYENGVFYLGRDTDITERFYTLDAMIEYYHKNPVSYATYRNTTAVFCRTFGQKKDPSKLLQLPVCDAHPMAPLVVGNTEDHLLCMECSKLVERYAIQKEKLAELREIFSRMDLENFSIGLLTESKVKSFLQDKGLPAADTSTIWNLADIDQDGFLSEEEFCIAMYLADLVMTNKTLPRNSSYLSNLIPYDTAADGKDFPEEILQMDQHSIQLYKECLEEQEEADHHVRVIVIGQTGVGKTTLTRNLLGLPPILPPEITKSTDGVDIHNSFVSLDDNTWVTDETEIQKASNCNDAKLIKLFRNTTNLEVDLSNADATNTYLDLQTKTVTSDIDDPAVHEVSQGVSSESDDIKFTLNEDTDISNNAVDSEETGARVTSPSPIIDEKASMLGCREFLEMMQAFENVKLKHSNDQSQMAGDLFLNTVKNLVMSQKDSIADKDDANYGELSVWDFAGQFVFYTTHHTFLTPRAVYLLVTRLDQNINDLVDNDQCVLDVTGCKELKIKDLVSYWMNSVHLYSHNEEQQPPVILVGTHLDKIQGDVERESKNYFVELRKSLLNTPTSRHLIDRDFTVSNHPTKHQIDSLQQKILELASKQKYWGEKIPARWIALEKAMMEEKLKGVCILSYEEVVEIDKSTGVPIGDQERLDLFLRFQHAIGKIIYFSEGCLKDHVVLSPQWLIDAFKCIITARQFCIENPALVHYWDDLNSTGKLHQCMVEGIFKKEDRFCRHKDHILGLMERLDIITRPSVNQDGDENSTVLQEFYFVPSLLQDKLTECQLNNYVGDTSRTAILCYVFKSNFLPPAVFHRLLSACLSKYPVAKQGSQFLMFCGCGIFDLNGGMTRLVVAFYDNIIQIGLYRFSLNKYPPDATTCTSVQKFATETLKRILGRYCMNLPFTLCLKCERSPLLSTEGLLSVDDLATTGEEMACHGHANKSHVINKYRHLQGWYSDKIPSNDTKSKHEDRQVESVIFGHLDAVPDNQELNRMSARIGKEFETLAYYLGMDAAEIFQIRSDHYFDTRSQIYHILLRWKQKSGKNATYRCLEEAFRQSEIDVDVLFGS